MPGIPQEIRIPRRGQVQTVAPQDETELVRLRTELELLRQCGHGANDAFASALQAKTQAHENLCELNAILHDARDSAVAASIDQIDTEAPHIPALIKQDVVQDEAAQIRADLAEQVRTSDADTAAALADEYETAAPEPAVNSNGQPLPQPRTTMSDTEMSDQAIEDVLQNVEDNVSALQELVEGSETPPAGEDGAADVVAAVTEEATPPEGEDQSDNMLSDEAVGEVAPPDASEHEVPEIAEDSVEPADEASTIEAVSETPPEIDAAADEPQAVEGEIDTPADGADQSSEPDLVSAVIPVTDGADAPVPPETVNSIQGGLRQMADFLVTEVNQLLTRAAAAHDEVLGYRAKAAAAQREVARLHAEVAKLKAEVHEAADLAHQARLEAQTHRDDAQRARTRAESKANDAETAADRALSEAQAVQSYAQQARKPAPESP